DGAAYRRRSRMRPIDLACDPGAQCVNGHADASPDADGRQLSTGKKLVDLAPADSNRLGGFGRPQEKFVHGEHDNPGQHWVNTCRVSLQYATEHSVPHRVGKPARSRNGPTSLVCTARRTVRAEKS